MTYRKHVREVWKGLAVYRARGSVSGGYNTSSVQKGEGREWKEDNLHLPSQTHMERLEDCVTIVSTVTYSCHVNIPICVYNGKHVKDGAAAAGALGSCGWCYCWDCKLGQQ